MRSVMGATPLQCLFPAAALVPHPIRAALELVGPGPKPNPGRRVVCSVQSQRQQQRSAMLLA
jgi:hypothetical protein